MTKKVLLLLIIVPFLVFSQEIPEPVNKSAFNESQFGGKFSYQILKRLLNEDANIITKDITKLNTKATDLYYEHSRPYDFTTNIDNLFRYKHLTSKEKQIEELDSIFNNNNNWKTTIIKNNLLIEILEPISRGSNLSIKNNTIYLSNPSFSENSKKYIHKFIFDNQKNIIFQGYGYTTSSKDTLYWKQTNSEYKNNEIFTQIKSIHRDSYGKLELKESETIFYQNGKILKKNKEFFNKNNEKYKAITTTYFYKKNNLVSSKSITKIFRNKIELEEPLSHIKTKYKKNKPIEISESKGKLKTLRKNKYDKKNRLIWSQYEAKNDLGKVVELSTEKIDYSINTYTYIYKEKLKITRGKERLPLQYKLSFYFF